MSKALLATIAGEVSPGALAHCQHLSDEQATQVLTIFNQTKNSVVMGYLFLLLIFGAHYAYNGKWGVQIIYWITFAGFGIWGLIDIFRMSSIIKSYNDKQLAKAIISARALTH
ncbi:TM2 domain-containing protein [Persicobacter psychrovividus]|uniref:TM2 domain-containing protein n=1 Tax=Persicobacter psychrovividus TaxID=387638 RepID=A0ABN6L5A1_9BACT|nr:hypothetical protein PEPS_05700 [Persicobacter psychrovividus]